MVSQGKGDQGTGLDQDAAVGDLLEPIGAMVDEQAADDAAFEERVAQMQAAGELDEVMRGARDDLKELEDTDWTPVAGDVLSEAERQQLLSDARERAAWRGPLVDGYRAASRLVDGLSPTPGRAERIL